MRHILSNYARDCRTVKRGGTAERLPFDENKLARGEVDFSSEQAHELVALNEALHSLERVDPRRSQVVECRFYGGMSVEDTATALGISPRTVKRDWVVAQAWLLRRMEEGST